MSEERREKVALALARRDGYQPDDIVDWRKTIYASNADAFIEQHPDTDLCSECGGTGFTYPEGGVIEISCPICSKPAEVVQSEVCNPAPGGSRISQLLDPIGKIVEVVEKDGHVDVVAELTTEGLEKLKDFGVRIEVADDSNSGIGQPDSVVGSADTSEPVKPRKPKTRKKPSRRVSSVLRKA